VNGGQICAAFTHIENTGACDEQAVFKKYEKKITRKDFIAELNRIHTDFFTYYKSNHLEVISQGSYHDEELFNGADQKRDLKLRKATADLRKFLLRVGFSEHALPEPNGVFNALTNKNPLQLIEITLAPSCQNVPRVSQVQKSYLPQCQEAGVRA